MLGLPSSTSAESTTRKRWRTRNSETLSCRSLPLSSTELPGRTASFKPSVSGSNRRIDHLRTGEYFTPCTYDTEPNDENKHDQIANHLTILIVYEFIIPVAQSRDCNADDVDGDDRGECEKRP